MYHGCCAQCDDVDARLEAAERELAEARAEIARMIPPLRVSDDPEETDAVVSTPTYVLMSRAAADSASVLHRRWRDERDEARALLRAVIGVLETHTPGNDAIEAIEAFLARTEGKK